MEEEEGEDEGEGIADDQGEDDNAEGATAEGQEVYPNKTFCIDLTAFILNLSLHGWTDFNG